jgi:hypothetical protein
MLRLVEFSLGQSLPYPVGGSFHTSSVNADFDDDFDDQDPQRIAVVECQLLALAGTHSK